MTATIAEFLASVGFKADEKSLKAALTKVAAFGVAVQATAVAVFAGVTRAAESEANLARQAEKLGSTSDRLRELGYVAEQNGSSLDAVTRSMEGLLAKNPRIKDAARALEIAGMRMKGMSRQARELYASRMGIDPELIPALTGDVAALKEEFRAMYAVAGGDARQAGEASKAFLAELSKLKTLAGLLARSVAAAFIGKIRKDIENLRKVIMENFGAIRRVFEMVIGLVLRVSGVISSFVYRAIKTGAGLIKWFDGLDERSRKLVLGLGLLLAAWKFLNIGFLATPLGMIITGLAAIVALVDDYLTYMEGGASAFNWGPWEKTIEGARAAIGGVIRAVGDFISRNRELLTGIGKVALEFAVFRKIAGPIMTVGRLLAAGGSGAGLLAKGIGVAKTAVKALFTLLRANPLGLILTVAALVYEGFFRDLWARIQASFSDFAAYLENIKNLWQALVGFVSALFSGDWAGAAEWGQKILDSLLGIFTSLGNMLLSILTAAWDGVKAAFPNFGAWAEGAASSIKGILGKAIAWVKDKLRALIDWMPDWVKEKMGLTGGAAEAAVPGDDSEGAAAREEDAASPPGDLARNAASWKEDAASPPGDLARNAESLDNARLTPSPGAAAAMVQDNRESNVTPNAKTDIHVVTSDPAAAGREVAARQGQANADTVRHMKGAAR